MLGCDLVALLRERGYRPTVHDLPECDICCHASLAAACREAAVVVNCAAFTDVDGAESQPERARAVNSEAVKHLGELAARADMYVLHIGTDFVFDGAASGAYRETDAPRPLSVYGASKLAGERALTASGCRHAIVRVQWTYGRAGRNFVSKLLERAATGKELKIVADQIGAPTWTRDVAGALLELIEARVTGLYHYAAAGYASRFEVAEHILAELGLQRPLSPCRTSDFAAPAQRPLNSRFDCSKIDALLRRPRRPWRDALTEFLQESAVKSGQNRG